MRESSSITSFHHEPGGDVGGWALSDAQNLSGAEGAAGEANVHTTDSKRTTGPPRGHQSAALRRGTELSRVRGARTRQRLTQLKVEEGHSLEECAEIMGMHYSRIRTVWREVVAKASLDEGVDSDTKEQVRAHMELQLRQIIQEGVANFGKGAAYGSAALAAMKQLADLYGLKGGQGLERAEEATLADVGKEVRAISPLLFKRMHEVGGFDSGDSGGTK